MILRPYQQECLDSIAAAGPGRWLCQMATGLGKTVTFSQIPHDRMLILSHREELVNQPRKYFDESYGIEQGANHANGEKVVSASIQSIVRRLNRFRPDEFDVVIVDECHHAAANTYRKVMDYFRPRQLIGFTATPNRGDRVRLDNVFDKIIFQRDLRWGIDNGYLSNIFCRVVDIGYDLRNVRTVRGDYAPGELDAAMEATPDAIADVYEKMHTGATLIFAVSVAHAQNIADRIPGAVSVTGETKDRADIIRRFTAREIPCLVNCMVFTEGTDIPLIETVIMARPTKSDSLYAQMVGRGLRLSEGKKYLNLIDCVGADASLCTAPSLLGIDMDELPPKAKKELDGELLTDLPEMVERAADTPENWIRNVEIVDLFAKRHKIDTRGVNFFKQPDGSLTVLGHRIPPMDALGMVTAKDGRRMPLQEAIDRVHRQLSTNEQDSSQLWNLSAVRRWAKEPVTEKQASYLKWRRVPDGIAENRGQAALIIERLKHG